MVSAELVLVSATERCQRTRSGLGNQRGCRPRYGDSWRFLLVMVAVIKST